MGLPPPQSLCRGGASEDATSDDERMVICEEEGDDDVMGKLGQESSESNAKCWFQFSWWAGTSLLQKTNVSAKCITNPINTRLVTSAYQNKAQSP